jgi:hypothetical protein
MKSMPSGRKRQHCRGDTIVYNRQQKKMHLFQSCTFVIVKLRTEQHASEL